MVYAALLPVTALAWDEQSKWDGLAKMMPYSKFELVFSKYTVGYISVAAAAALCGTLLSTALIPVIFYTYSGVLGYNISVLNILTFVAAVLIGVLTFFRLCKSGAAERFYPVLFAANAAVALLFYLFSAGNRAFCGPYRLSFSVFSMDISAKI